jgi:hypothetical protein
MDHEVGRRVTAILTLAEAYRYAPQCWARQPAFRLPMFGLALAFDSGIHGPRTW